MPDVPTLNAAIALALGIAGLVTLVIGWIVKGRPWLHQRRDDREAINEVLLGRKAIPANRITGAKAQDAKPSIGQLVADIHHELHPNNGSSMKDALTRVETAVAEIQERLERGDDRFDRIEAQLAEDLHTATDGLANAAEAAAHLLPTLHDAINAKPPTSED